MRYIDCHIHKEVHNSHEFPVRGMPDSCLIQVGVNARKNTDKFHSCTFQGFYSLANKFTMIERNFLQDKNRTGPGGAVTISCSPIALFRKFIYTWMQFASSCGTTAFNKPCHACVSQCAETSVEHNSGANVIHRSVSE